MKLDAPIKIKVPVAARELKAGRPASVTRGWIVAAGAVAWFASLWFIRIGKLQNAVLAAVICMAALVVVNCACDVLFRKVQASPSTGLDWKKIRPSWYRTAIKFAGLLGSLGFIGALYWLFPEYHGDFYVDYKELLRRTLPWALALSMPYIYFVDARQKDPHDGYYAAGMALTLQFDKVDAAVLRQHCLSWLVKGFFAALMFTYYVRDLRKYFDYDFSGIRDFRAFYDGAYFIIFLADVGFACTGYFFTFRIFDTHVRRTEPTFKGWMAALVCYQPFWSFVSGAYLSYTSDFVWGNWLPVNSVFYVIWGSTILVLYGIYLWATIMFGCRFSNLTHRGILTNGPYRWTRHPAYIGKILAYWMTLVPFIISQSAGDSLRRCLLLGLLSYIYYIRAKTEEANLGADPAYVQYANWIKQHGIFRWFKRSPSISSR